MMKYNPRHKTCKAKFQEMSKQNGIKTQGKIKYALSLSCSEKGSVSDGQNTNFQPRQASTITGWTTKEDYREEEDGENKFPPYFLE